MVCVGGGVVEGLFDSMDIEPRVRFGVLFGVSSETILTAIFFSNSLALPWYDKELLEDFDVFNVELLVADDELLVDNSFDVVTVDWCWCCCCCWLADLLTFVNWTDVDEDEDDDDEDDVDDVGFGLFDFNAFDWFDFVLPCGCGVDVRRAILSKINIYYQFSNQ